VVRDPFRDEAEAIRLANARYGWPSQTSDRPGAPGRARGRGRMTWINPAHADLRTRSAVKASGVDARAARTVA
jgi:hypothetical protein